MARPTVAALVALLGAPLGGCGDAPPPVERRIRPALSTDPACTPETRVGSLTLTALSARPGPMAPPVLRVSLDDGPTALDGLPGDLAALRLVAETSDARFRARALLLAGALAALPEAQEARPLLLPDRVPCVLADPALRLPAGAAIAGLSTGGLWIAGGIPDGGPPATRGVVRLPGAGGLVEVLAEQLLTRRLGATAVAVGERVVAVGGAAAPGELGSDTFEVWDDRRRRFDREGGGVLCRTGDCPGRFLPGVVAMGPEGPVLVAGGAERAPDEEGAPPTPVAAVVLVDPVTGAVDDELPPLPRPLAAPDLLRLDDGAVWSFGGVDGDGLMVREVARFDPGTGAFSPEGPALPSEATALALVPGGRVVALAPGGTSATVWCGADEPPRLARTPLPGALPGGPLRVAATPSGRVLVFGLRDGRPSGVLLDPGRGALEAVVVRRLPDRLVTLAEGTVLALDATGAVAYRPETRHPLDPPPESIRAADVGWLAPAAGDRFEAGPRGTLRARSAGARLWVPAFEALDVDLSLVADGPWAVVLTEASPAGVAPRFRLGPGDGACPLDGTVRSVTRRGRRITLAGGDGAEATCVLDLPGDAPVTLGLEALAVGATFDTFRVRRR